MLIDDIVARSGIKTQYYWEPELEDVYNALKRLDERVKAGNPRAEEKRARYILERKRYVDEVLDVGRSNSEFFLSLTSEQRQSVLAAIIDSIDNVFIMVIAACALSLLLSIFMKRERLFVAPAK